MKGRMPGRIPGGNKKNAVGDSSCVYLHRNRTPLVATPDIINPRPTYPADIIINRNKLFDPELTPRYYITPSFSSVDEIREGRREGIACVLSQRVFPKHGWKMCKKEKKGLQEFISLVIPLGGN